MDDSLEKPTALPAPNPSLVRLDEEDEQSSGDEDGGLDWTKLPGLSRPVIPKRGEKDFEPSAGGGSGLQLHVLDKARSAMFETLKATRDTSSKSISYAIWYPGIARAHVTMARGIHFSAMGHSVPRPIKGDVRKAHKRLELLPEEAIYLVERGTMFCWKESALASSDIPGLEDVEGSPMSVQQAVAEMIGREDLTLEKYQVFSYLKRLGYAVTRTEPPTPAYPSPPPHAVSKRTSTLMQRLLSIFPLWLSRLSRLFTRKFNWWRPLRLTSWVHHNENYASVFKSLRFMRSGHDVPIQSAAPEYSPPSPYRIFYNLYKPSTPFRKTAPPPPDFSIVVINARTTPMPTLQELSALFGVLPELPPPLPRQRRPIPAKPTSDEPTPLPSVSITSPVETSLFRRVFSWVCSRPPTSVPPPPRKPNPFMALKAGKKNIVIAVVDAGSISFFRFSQGAFSEWPMI